MKKKLIYVLGLAICMLINLNTTFSQVETDTSNLSKKFKLISQLCDRQKDSISILAMNKILDLSYPEENRIALVILLAEIGTDTSINFLLDHVNMSIYSGAIFGDGDMAKARIFVTALTNHVSNRWKVINNILLKTNRHIDDSNFSAIATVLVKSCGSNKIARMILEGQFRGSKEPLRYNLNKLLSVIPSQ